MQPETYACEADGIYRVERDGTATRLCPPIVVLGCAEDDNPTRPLGKLIRLAWADHASSPWQEALVPSPLVADEERLTAYLGKRGWSAVAAGWHPFVVAAAIQHLGFPALRPADSSVGV